jgi:hypothetical protein
MTFTAARIKQEIAKEGILPFSLIFATSHTPISWWWSRGRPQKEAGDHLEQTPTATLGLHGITSIILIGATSMLDPSTSYEVLLSLYAYAIHVLIGFFVAGGLLYLKFRSSTNWSSCTNFSPWFDPLPAIVFWATRAFLLITTLSNRRVTRLMLMGLVIFNGLLAPLLVFRHQLGESFGSWGYTLLCRLAGRC